MCNAARSTWTPRRGGGSGSRGPLLRKVLQTLNNLTQTGAGLYSRMGMMTAT